VVVVGGGAAGLTAAAGIARLDPKASVVVLERERHVLPLQRDCYKRHLHPNIFDWPDEKAGDTRANLPLLNWKAGMARDVAFSIESGFHDLEVEYGGRLRLCCGAQDLQIDLPERNRLSFRADGRRLDLPYGTLVFALGFGVEDSLWAGQRGSYWADNSLDQHGVFPRSRYLISGTGDGGLIDLLRVVFTNCRQDDLARIVEWSPNFAGLRATLREIDADATVGGNREGSILYDAYEKLDLPDLDRTLGERVNHSAHVTLLTRSASPFALSTRPLHRLLLSRLLFRFSERVDVRCNTTLERSMLQHEGHGARLVHGSSTYFDQVVVHHGRNGAPDPAAEFPPLLAALRGTARGSLPVEAHYRDAFSPTVSAIAWSGGPHEHDYLDELRAHVSTVPGGSGAEHIPIERFDAVFVEVRTEARTALASIQRVSREERQKSRAVPPRAVQTTGEIEDRAARDRERQAKEGERELQELYDRRFWSSVAGVAIQPSSHVFRGVTLLHGRMGTGKSTFLRQAVRAAVTTYCRDNQMPFPVFINKAPEIEGASMGDVPEALADAALRTLEMATYSRAAAHLRATMLRRKAILFVDTVDGWTDDTFHALLGWLRDPRACAIVAARHFPLSPIELSRIGDIELRELLGIAPSSTKEFLECHFERLDVIQFLEQLGCVPNADEWRTNPFLLTLAAGLAEGGAALDERTSLLTLYDRRIAQVLPAGAAGDAVRETLRQVARTTLCATPTAFSFPRQSIARAARDQCLATNLITGNHNLEFSHLSVGEYLADPRGRDLVDARGHLLESGITWHHRLEVLAMAHARSAAHLEEALADAQEKDVEHRRLALVLRAVAYGGEEVQNFCSKHGSRIVEQVRQRMSLPSARFGGPERELMRAMDRALQYLQGAALDPTLLPSRGEPGAEAWALAVSLQVSSPTARPPAESYWWPTIYHQARGLVGCEPATVSELTRGGSHWSRANALFALASDAEMAELLTARDNRLREEALGRSPMSFSARQFDLIRDEDERVRRRVFEKQPQEFWEGPGAQAVLEAIARHDPSPSVRAKAIRYLSGERLELELVAQLRELTRPRTSVGMGEQELLTVLLSRLEHASAARDVIDEFLASGDGWFCDAQAYRSLCRDPARAEILHRRLKSENPNTREIEAAKGGSLFTEALRGIISRLVRTWSGSYLLPAAIHSIPPNDVPSRADRLACLDPSVAAGSDDKNWRDEVQRSAIFSFAEDAEAVPLLRRFLEQTESDALACAALHSIGKASEVRTLVWKQLTEGPNNASMEAARILCADPSQSTALLDHVSRLPREDALRDHQNAWIRATILRSLEARLDRTLVVQLLDDPAEPVREFAASLLLRSEPGADALKERVFNTWPHSVEGPLWKAFGRDPTIRAELQHRAREDQWEVRQAYFHLVSRDEVRLARLRDHFRELEKGRPHSDALAEILPALARDGEALPLIRDLVRSKNMRVRCTLLNVLRDDPELRTDARRLLAESVWVSDFSFTGEGSFLRYFADDDEAKAILVKALQEGLMRRCVDVAIPLLRGYAPAAVLLRAYMADSDQNISFAAKAALVDEPDVRAAFVTSLASAETSESRQAAHALQDTESAWGLLSLLTTDDDTSVRRIAYDALARLDQLEPNAPAMLAEECDSRLRSLLVQGMDSSRPETRVVLRQCVSGDFSAEVRTQAASRLPRAEARLALRADPTVRGAVDAGTIAGEALGVFLVEPRLLVRREEGKLYADVIAWLCAKLVSTLPDEATPLSARHFADGAALFGEREEGSLAEPCIRLRLAMDSSELPRNRNIWPAANTLMAWDIARHLLTEQPQTVLVACADVHFGDLVFPELLPGEVRMGPTFFGFRIGE
jgi:hypothetical protein